MRRFLNTVKNHKNWVGYYLYKWFGDRKKGFTFRTRSGLVIEVPGRMMQTYKECFFDETYYRGFPQGILKAQAPVVVDVGANVGYFSLSVFARFPQARVIAFEPMPVNFNLLISYKNQNPALAFTPVNEAVSGAEGSLTLHYNAKDDFTTSASIHVSAREPDTAVVHTTTLAALMHQHGLSHIDLLKLDCEGSEYSVLYTTEDPVLNKIKALAIETHEGPGHNENKKSLMEFLKSRNFHLRNERDIIWAWRES